MRRPNLALAKGPKIQNVNFKKGFGPQLDEVQIDISTKIFFPIEIENPGCLNCHSTPDIAPPAMLDLYGSENGFGWEFGETVGAQIITVPTTLIARRAEETALLVGSALLAAFGLVLILTNLLLSRVVIRPVRYLTDMAERVSMGDFSVPESASKSRDEIGSLAGSFNRMRRSLERAMAMLESNE